MEMSEMIYSLIKKANEIELEVINNVFEQAYKRKITKEDYKKIQLNFNDGVSHKYDLVISGINVGTIYRNYLDPKYLNSDLHCSASQEFKVTFEPHKEFTETVN